jgi:hypothetical protein
MNGRLAMLAAALYNVAAVGEMCWPVVALGLGSFDIKCC